MITCNGEKLEVRDIGDPIYSISAHQHSYIPFHGYKIMSDDDARELLKSFKGLGDIESKQRRKENEL